MTFMQSGSFFTRRRVLTGAASMAVLSLIEGCEKNSDTPVAIITPSIQPVPTGSTITATAAVTTQAGGMMPSNFVGLSYSKNEMYQNLFVSTNANLIGLMQRLGPGVIRIGAIPVEWSTYNALGAGNVSGQIAPSDIDRLSAFVKAAGWQCIYAVNLEGYAPTGVTVVAPVVATTPALAAAEVAYAVKSFGSSLLGIELGNEPDNYTWTFGQFKTQWEAMRTAIVALSPGVTITGPGNGHDVVNETVPFAQFATSSQLGILTQHFYIGCGCDGMTTVQNMVAYPNTDLTTNYLVPLQAASTSLGIPYRITEANSYYSDTQINGLEDTYGSALWVIDFLMTCAQYGCAGVNIFGGGNGPSFTPIVDNVAGTIINPRPEYYGMELVSLAGQGTLVNATLSTGSLNVSAFAVKTASGGINLIINNKEVTNLQMTVTLPQTIHVAALLDLTQIVAGQTLPVLAATPASLTSGDQSAGTTLQGSEISLNGNFLNTPAYTPYVLTPNGMQVTCYVPALSAVLIQIT